MLFEANGGDGDGRCKRAVQRNEVAHALALRQQHAPLALVTHTRARVRNRAVAICTAARGGVLGARVLSQCSTDTHALSFDLSLDFSLDLSLPRCDALQ